MCMFPVFTRNPQSQRAQDDLALAIVAAAECGLQLNCFIESQNEQHAQQSIPRRVSRSALPSMSRKTSRWNRLKTAILSGNFKPSSSVHEEKSRCVGSLGVVWRCWVGWLTSYAAAVWHGTVACRCYNCTKSTTTERCQRERMAATLFGTRRKLLQTQG